MGVRTMLRGHIMPETIDQWCVVRSNIVASSPPASSAAADATLNVVVDPQIAVQLLNKSNSIMARKPTELMMKNVRKYSQQNVTTINYGNRFDANGPLLTPPKDRDSDRSRRKNSRSRYSLAEYRLNLLLYRK